jgi:hypothetical protein
MSDKKKSKINNKEIVENPEVPLGIKLLYAAAGTGFGGVLHHFAGMYRGEVEKNIMEKLPDVHGSQIGTLTTFFSMMLPENKMKYFVAGTGIGITIDDVLHHVFKYYNGAKIKIGDLKPFDPVSKYSSLLHIDENLSVPEKEAIILPYFAKIIVEQRENPAQKEAILRLIKEVHISKNKLGLIDCYWLREWMLYYGIYQGNEGLWPGHDRVRTLAKLMRVRDSGSQMKDGHTAFLFDCDDGATVVNQIMDYFGYSPKFALISQKPELADGVHQLHHIFPVVKAMGKLWMVETIKPYPIVPLEYAHEVFDNLYRVVLITSDGSYGEFEDWKKNRLRKTIEMAKHAGVSVKRRK